MSVLLALALALALAEDVSVPEYRDGLVLVATRLQEGDLEAARLAARHLLRVRLPDGLSPDASLLKPLADAASLDAAKAFLPRLRALVDALEEAPAGTPPPAADHALLDRIRAREALAVRQGQPHVGPSLHPLDVEVPFMARVKKLWDDFWGWVGRLLRALLQLLFRSGPGEVGGDVRMWTLLAVALVLGGLLTAFFLRRRSAARPETGEAVSQPLKSSARDEDPLSRTANEWERFAADLMRQGRFREAIRGWYHAALVTLFRTGHLHYRKDRTNWEYAFQLPPDFDGRGVFLEATRTFEREWYGRAQTPSETALGFESTVRDFLGRLREGVPA